MWGPAHLLLCCWSNEGVGALDTSRPNLSGVADDDREEGGVEEKDEGGHCKAEVLAGLSRLLSPKIYRGELSQHSKQDVARCQVLQALAAGQLQDQEDDEGKTEGKGHLRVEQVSIK